MGQGQKQNDVFLSASPNFTRNASGRSVAYFATQACTGVAHAEILALVAEAEHLGKVNMRICLHGDSANPFHDMVILEYPNSRYFRPHRHADKAETCHMIEGRVGLFVFDDDGNVQQRTVLDGEHRSLYRIGANTYHTLVPLSDRVVYHESKLGPFLGDDDSLYPDWAPDGADHRAAADYIKHLIAGV